MSTDGETPLSDFDGLRKRRIRTRSQLAVAEAENIRRAVIRYLVAVPSRKVAAFDFGWMLRLHSEMFGDVWSWAGQIRDRSLSLGSDPAHIGEHLAQLCDDIRGREPADLCGESPIRPEYIACLRAADGRDMKPLLDLHPRHQPSP